MGGTKLSSINLEIFSRCVEAWLFLIEDLMTRQELSASSRKDRMNNFIHAVAATDVEDLLLSLDAIHLLLISEEEFDVPTFKQRVASTASGAVHLERLLSPIWPALVHVLNARDRETKTCFLPTVVQFVSFPHKLEFQTIGLENQALEDYLITEQELDTVHDQFSESCHDLADLIGRWFRDFHIENLLPKHGVGSVAEGPLTLGQKFKRMRIDQKIKILLRNPSFPSSYQDYFPDCPPDGLDRCSRTIFVPKTALKMRTISMEPIALQYLQQGVMGELYRYIEKHPYLGVRVPLQDQRQNQVLSWEGSKYHNYGTIDLSKASDTVRWDLVRRVFSQTPLLYKWLLATRSIMTELPDGERLLLRKFAPMGSALCFPIECIIFAAIVEYSLSKVHRRGMAHNELYSVYGDDLVVPAYGYGEVIKNLAIFGFIPNTRKSYNTGEYRESCGKEYYGGVDITPLYYRVPFYNSRPSPSAYGSWCSSANNAVEHRLPLYRWYLIQKILDASRGRAKFGHSPESSPTLYSSQPTNHRIRRRWNKDYQRWEGKFVVVVSQPRSEEFHDDRYRYFMKLVEMARRSSTPPDRRDEPARPYALSGYISKFRLMVLPMEDRCRTLRTTAVDWTDT